MNFNVAAGGCYISARFADQGRVKQMQGTACQKHTYGGIRYAKSPSSIGTEALAAGPRASGVARL
eukprot:SAG11_NODE_2138_length_3763_cov_2.690229_4_plen_65_part_00